MRRLIVAAWIGVAAGPAAAQAPDNVKDALAILQRDNAWTVEQQVSLCEIPAPPFKEEARGAEYARRLRALGYPVTVDPVGNVIATRRGTGGGQRFVLAAHLDTVFPEGTDVSVKREGTKLMGPGIGDDCRGLAVVLAVARALELAKVATRGDIVFVGNVGEEGPGNLRGTRHLFGEKTAGQIDSYVSVDGIGFGAVSRAVGSNRYVVTFAGPGGHSFGAFGMPNPIHAMGRAIALIGDFQVPSQPKTTFNVGIIEGGTSVNSISFKATMQVDLRSESAEELARLDAAFRRAVDQSVQVELARWPKSKATLTATLTDMGQRPAGAQPDSIWILRSAQRAAVTLGIPVPQPSTSSTDANVPISLGIPALSLDGGGTGGGAHSLGEWYDDGAEGWLGPQWTLLVSVEAASRNKAPPAWQR